MKSMLREFKDFVSRGNLVELAIAFILATAFAPVVLSIVDNIIMPIIAAIVGPISTRWASTSARPGSTTAFRSR